VIEKINGELVRMLKEPSVRERMAREGADPVGSSPQQFSQRVASEVDKWSKVAKAAGLAVSN
jgi:tripartite-type tricarboxylate transporter receptor subunit TctC